MLDKTYRHTQKKQTHRERHRHTDIQDLHGHINLGHLSLPAL